MQNLILGIGSRVKHPKWGQGVVIQCWADAYDITFIDYGKKQITLDEEMQVIEFVSTEPDMVSFTKVQRELVKMLRRFTDLQETVEMGSRWNGGTLLLKPGDSSLASKEVPIETFFHKIVMVRDRLRVMEQKVNASKLSDADKVEIQQYITRIYGSLTTFNVLFAEKDDYFVGEKGKD